jgi:hypothetical protein
MIVCQNVRIDNGDRRIEVVLKRMMNESIFENRRHEIEFKIGNMHNNAISASP